MHRLNVGMPVTNTSNCMGSYVLIPPYPSKKINQNKWHRDGFSKLRNKIVFTNNFILFLISQNKQKERYLNITLIYIIIVGKIYLQRSKQVNFHSQIKCIDV